MENIKHPRFRATYGGIVIGWYDTLAEAENAIAIAEDPHGPEALQYLILGEEYFTVLRNNANRD